MIARVKYTKGQDVKYVGHLDCMRTFIRCIKRTCIPVKYSNGFNPRVQISFALPLGVGVTSDCEYFDLEVEQAMNSEMFLGELNSTLPSGFRVIEVEFLETAKSLMSLVKEAEYKIKIEGEDFEKVIELFDKDSIVIEKESNSKKETKEIELKNFILDISFDKENKDVYVHSTAGSVNNMNPNFIVDAVEKYVGEVEDYDIHRVKLII